MKLVKDPSRLFVEHVDQLLLKLGVLQKHLTKVIVLTVTLSKVKYLTPMLVKDDQTHSRFSYLSFGFSGGISQNELSLKCSVNICLQARFLIQIVKKPRLTVLESI